jgi:endonuclease/exonuclease/phosphatase (EEP) superfamily protein YafD
MFQKGESYARGHPGPPSGDFLMNAVIMILWSVLWLLTVSLCLMTLTGFMARVWWIFDLSSHFRFQYMILLVMCAIIGLLTGKFLLSILAGFGAVLNLMVILPLYLPSPRFELLTPRYRLLLSNVLGTNPHISDTVNLIERANPDIIVLIEPTETWLETILPHLANYPHRILVPRPDNYGIALLSRHALKRQETIILGPYQKPSIIASLDLEGKLLTLLGTHAQPPFNALDSAHRDQQIKEVVAYASQFGKPALILGDFNATSWSAALRDVSKAGWKDSRVGFGIQASWPVANPLLRVPIDHIFTTPDVVVHNRRLGSPVGSDHLPVILDFSIA